MYRYVKRAMDFTVSLLMLVVLSPLMLCAALLIKSNHDGPVLFTQIRPGKDGKCFKIFKFRTMSVNTCDENGTELSDFQRMSKIGRLLRKTSVDELPQLINVLKGDMSFIGPRPLLTEYLELYTPKQMRRHEVRPGISGWAQVNGRNALSWEDRFEFDVYYVENCSFKLDLIIFFRTIKNVLLQDGINSNSDNTMEKFTGSVKTPEEA